MRNTNVIEFVGYSEQTKSFVRADNSLQTALPYMHKMLFIEINRKTQRNNIEVSV
jgi:hypothetical protein